MSPGANHTSPREWIVLGAVRLIGDFANAVRRVIHVTEKEVEICLLFLRESAELTPDLAAMSERRAPDDASRKSERLGLTPVLEAKRDAHFDLLARGQFSVELDAETAARDVAGAAPEQTSRCARDLDERVHREARVLAR